MGKGCQIVKNFDIKTWSIVNLVRSSYCTISIRYVHFIIKFESPIFNTIFSCMDILNVIGDL